MGNSYSPKVCTNCQNWNQECLSPQIYVLSKERGNEKVMEHRLPVNYSKHPSEELYRWRLENKGNKNIVEVIQLNNQVRIHRCCKHVCRNLSLYTQFIHSVSSINSLSFTQILNLFLDWINGMKTLRQEFGYVSVKASMLGWNQSGVGKVWVNGNYSLNQPYEVLSFEQSREYEKYVLSRFVEIVLNEYRATQTQQSQLVKMERYNFMAAKNKIEKLKNSYKEENRPRGLNQLKTGIKIETERNKHIMRNHDNNYETCQYNYPRNVSAKKVSGEFQANFQYTRPRQFNHGKPFTLTKQKHENDYHAPSTKESSDENSNFESFKQSRFFSPPFQAKFQYFQIEEEDNSFINSKKLKKQQKVLPEPQKHRGYLHQEMKHYKSKGIPKFKDWKAHLGMQMVDSVTIIKSADPVSSNKLNTRVEKSKIIRGEE